MKKIKIGLVILCFLVISGLVTANEIYGQKKDNTVNSLEGKIIALDAGHGGDDLGAQYPANCATDNNIPCRVYEKNVNLAVVNELKNILKANGAEVVLTREGDETIISRRDRVAIAEQKCSIIGGECDALVSVHHNGSTDPTHDGTYGNL